MKITIQKKIVAVVVIAVTIAFFMSGIGSSLYFYSVLKDNTIKGEQHKISQSARQLENFQNTIISIGKQIVINDELQQRLREDTKADIVAKLLTEDAVKRICRTFINQQPYIYGVTILTKEGSSFSSNATEGAFIPEMEEWYLEFKESGQLQGFSSPHDYILEQGSKKKKVISYVMAFRDIQGKHEVMGDIILHVGISEIEKYAKLETSLLAGYSMYDRWGNSIAKQGTLSTDFDQIKEIEGEITRLSNRNILLKNINFEDEWIFAGEISNKLLWKQLKFVPLFFLIVFVAMMLLLCFILVVYIRKITRPIETLHKAAVKVGQGDMDVFVRIDTQDELAVLGQAFNQMVSDLKIRMEESIEHEKVTKEMEINRLMLQINPHFIYNTLNSIVYMAKMEGNQNIVLFANAFISLLQDTLKVDSKDIFIPMEQEVKNIKNYLTLQSFRYANRFEVKYEIEESLYHSRVPNVLIQPIVENAIFHGLAGKIEKGILEIKIRKQKDDIEIIVSDDGIGMEADMIKDILNEKGAIGFGNVKKRIEHIYGASYGMTIESKVNQGTRVRILIPYEEFEEDMTCQQNTVI